DEAKSQATKIVDGMASSDVLTLLRAGANVTTACSACNRLDAQHAISAMVPGAGSADIAGALAVTSGIARQKSSQVSPTKTTGLDAVVISDGEFTPPPTDGIDF